VKRLSLVAVLVLLPRVTAGQELPRQPLQELFLTEVVYPQEKGEVQLTLESLVDRSRADLSGLASLEMEFGLTDRWQIQGRWDGYTQFHDSPFNRLQTARVTLGTKYSFMHIAHSRVHAALGIDAEFPRAASFADDEGEAEMELEPFVALAADVWRGLTFFGSVGASVKPRQVKELAQHGERPDDPGTISVGTLIAFRHATLAATYTSRSDGLPWRLDGPPLVTPSLVVHGGRWELALGTPLALRGDQHRPGLAMHVIREF